MKIRIPFTAIPNSSSDVVYRPNRKLITPPKPLKYLRHCDCGNRAVTTVPIEIRNADGRKFKYKMPLCRSRLRMENLDSIFLPEPDLCSNCGVHPAKTKGRCNTCYNYYHRHGSERPEHLHKQIFKCKNCGVEINKQTSNTVRGYCGPCYAYLREHDRERPHYLWL